MSHLHPGLLSAYNSLTDRHLTGYFNNTRIRRHLQRVGLITRTGRIVPDKEYRHRLIQRAHQRHVRECLAQAIFHKVLDMERIHQIEIKRKLEEFARRERVHKIKVDRSKRYEEDVIHILSPRPPPRPKVSHAQHSGPEGEHTESSESPGSSRPNTAPGKMQRPVRLKPIHSSGTAASHRRRSPHRPHDSSNDTDQSFNCTVDKDSRRHWTMTEFSRGVSPYRLPVINNFVTPVPPPTKRKERGLKGTPNGTLRGRRLRPTTAPSPGITEFSPMPRSSVQSNVCVNMVFFGKTVHLSHDFIDMRDEVKVFQQHCGGENLCVYKGKLREGETFHLVSRRHRGFPFSLTFFLNGLQVERLSSCCEFKHRKGSRLGGRHGHFGVTGVEGASPCYKCIIAMGLDKKPTPPPKRIKEEVVGRSVTISSPQQTVEDASEVEEKVAEKDTHSEPACRPQDMETEIKEDIPPGEDKPKDDYEEDFEADEEEAVEEVGEEKDKKTLPPFPQREGEEDDHSDSEEEDKEENRSGSSSSSADSDSEPEAEAKEDQPKDQPADQPADQPKDQSKDQPKDPAEEEVLQQEQDGITADTAAETDKTSTEGTSPTPPQTTTTTGGDTGTSPGDSAGRTEVEVSNTSGPSETECKRNEDSVGAAEESYAEGPVDRSTQEEEPERAKSVQEKLAAAILKEPQCSSEPELSDTSTEDSNADAVPAKATSFTLKRRLDVKCEDTVVSAQEVTSQSAIEEQGDVSAEQKTEDDDTTPESAQKTEEASGSTEENEDVVSPATEEAEVKIEADNEAVEVQVVKPAKETDAEDAAETEQQEEEHKTTEETDTQLETEQETEETKNTSPEQKSNTEVETAETEPKVNSEKSEEESVTDKERKGDEEDTLGVTAENSHSSSEGSGDTTVHTEKRAEAGENSEDEPVTTEDEAVGDVEEARKGDKPGTEDTKEKDGETVGEVEKGVTKEGEVGEKDKERDGIQDNGDEVEENTGEDKVEDEEKSSDGKVEEKEKDEEVTEDEQYAEGKGDEGKQGDGTVAKGTDKVEDEEVEKKDDEGKTKDEGEVEDGEKLREDRSAVGEETDQNVTTKAEEMLEGDEKTDEENDTSSSKEEKRKSEIDADHGETATASEAQSESQKEETESTIQGGKDKHETKEENIDQNDTEPETKTNEVNKEKSGEVPKDLDETSEKREDVQTVDPGLEPKEGSTAETSDPGEAKAIKEAQEPGEEPQEHSEQKTDSNESYVKTTLENEDKESDWGTQNEKFKMNVREVIVVSSVLQTSEPTGLESNPDLKANVESTAPRGSGANTEEMKRRDGSIEDASKPSDEGDSIVHKLRAETQHAQGQAVTPETLEKEDHRDLVSNWVNLHQTSKFFETFNDPLDEIKGLTSDDTASESNSNARGSTHATEQLRPESPVKALRVRDQKAQREVHKETDTDSKETDRDHEETYTDHKETDTDHKETDHKETDTDHKDTDRPTDHKETDTDHKETDTDHKETDTDHKETDTDHKETDKDHKETDTDHKETYTDHKETDTDHKETDTDHKETDTDHKETDTDHKETDTDHKETDTDHKETDTDHKETDTDHKETDIDHKETDTDHKETEPSTKDEHDSDTETKVEAIQSDLRSNNSREDEPSETGPTKEVNEETEVTDFFFEAEHDSKENTVKPVEEYHRYLEEMGHTKDISEDDQTKHEDDKDTTQKETEATDVSKTNMKNTVKPLEECQRSLEEIREAKYISEDEKTKYEDDKDTTQKETEATDVSQTDVESLSGSSQSVTSVKENISENPTEAEDSKDKSGMDEQQTTVEEITDLLTLSKTEEEPQEHSESPEHRSKSELAGTTSRASEDTKDIKDSKEQESTEVTEVTDLTVTSKPENGSQGDLQSVWHQHKDLDESGNGDNKELVGDFKETLSKDGLSTFSVDESSVFTRTSYPLLTAARTESGY